MTAWWMWPRKLWAVPVAPYIGAVAVRATSRAVWGLALPMVLTVSAYGRYQLLATIAVTAGQVAMLGTPQTIVRHAGRRLPMGMLMLHAVALGVVGIAAAVALVPATRSPGAIGVLAVTVLATIGATLLGARAKARFAFTRSWAAEAAGAGVLVAATVVLTVAAARSWLAPATALLIEALAIALTATILFRSRPLHADPAVVEGPPPARPALLGDVYSVGVLVILDVVLFRRLEVYFLERSPDGLAGVAVLGLSLQIAAVALLVPSALLEAWQPRLVLIRSRGGDFAFVREVRRRGNQFLPMMVGVTLVGTVVPLGAITLLFPQYTPWLWYVVAFVGVRLACAGAGLYSAALYAAGRQRALYAPAVSGGVVAVVANVALTRSMGLRGALIAYALTQAVVAVLTVLVYRRATAVREPDATGAVIVGG